MSTSLKIRRARTTDPVTSKLGERDVASRAPSQMMLLLMTYVDRARTDEDAAIMVGLQNVGYWKRCSDLRSNGFIEPVKIGKKDLTRRASTGSLQRVCRITDDGREELRKKGLL